MRAILHVHQHPVGAPCAVRGDRLVAIRALVHVVGEARQDGPDQRANLRTVVDDQHGHAGVAGVHGCVGCRNAAGNRRR